MYILVMYCSVAVHVPSCSINCAVFVLPAPCDGTMWCMYCSQFSSSVAWAGQAGRLWPDPVVLI